LDNLSEKGVNVNLIKEAVYSLKKYKFTSFTIIMILAFNLLIIGMFALIMFNLNNFMDEIRDSVEITVFLKEGIKKEVAEAVMVKIKQRNGIEDALFVSREDALKEFANNEDFKSYLDNFKLNPLPDSIRVVVKKEFKEDSAKIKEFADYFSAIEGVSEIYYQKEEIEKFFNFAGIIRRIIIWISAILLLGSVFIVSSTIRVSVFSRREDIKKMKIDGVSLLGIKAIFIVESIIQGAVGGLLAAVFLYLLEKTAIEKLNILWSGKWQQITLPMACIIVLAGILLGAAGSLFFRIKNYADK